MDKAECRSSATIYKLKQRATGTPYCPSASWCCVTAVRHKYEAIGSASKLVILASVDYSNIMHFDVAIHADKRMNYSILQYHLTSQGIERFFGMNGFEKKILKAGPDKFGTESLPDS